MNMICEISLARPHTDCILKPVTYVACARRAILWREAEGVSVSFDSPGVQANVPWIKDGSLSFTLGTALSFWCINRFGGAVQNWARFLRTGDGAAIAGTADTLVCVEGKNVAILVLLSFVIAT